MAHCYSLNLKCPSKAHTLKACFPNPAAFRGGAFRKWLDHEGSDLNELVHWWFRIWWAIGKWWKLREWNIVEDSGMLGATPGSFLSHSLILLAAMKWAALLHHAFPITMLSLTSGPQWWAKWPWTKTSETMRQNRSLFFLNHFFQLLFCDSDKNQTGVLYDGMEIRMPKISQISLKPPEIIQVKMTRTSFWLQKLNQELG
jgi:hypothetical protein